jgi:ParB family transcriptional regulator, chromosome partitioning protein
MASQAKPADVVVDQVLELAPETIEVSDDSRIGFFFPEKAEAYAVLIAANGQRDPIKVRRNGSRAKFPWTLVAGRHRHAACVIAGIKVRAIEVKGDADELRSVQASENLDRRELAPLEKAMFVAAVVDVAQAKVRALHGGKSQQQVAIEQRWNGSNGGDDIRGGNLPQRIEGVQFTPIEKADAEAELAGQALAATYRWREASAAACGLSIDALKRSLRIFRIIVEPNRDLMQAFKDCAAAANASALLAICAQGGNPANVRKAIEWLIAHPQAKTADEALVALDMMPSRGSAAAAPATGDTKFLNGLQSNLQRLSLSGQRRAADVIAQSIAPSALVAVRDALNARIAAMEADQSSKGETK